MTPPKVADIINGWRVTRIWEWFDWWDCNLISPKGEWGCVRILKKERVRAILRSIVDEPTGSKKIAKEDS